MENLNLDPAWVFIKELFTTLFSSGISISLSSFILGIICCPLLIFLRARRDPHWDNSNMTNIYRVIAHLAAHPSDFGLLQYPSGKKPFWYINKDELSDVVDSRPNPEDLHLPSGKTEDKKSNT